MFARFNTINAVVISLLALSGTFLKIRGCRINSNSIQDNGMCLILIGVILMLSALTITVIANI
ncbi:MAG: hypothetical protein IKF80_04135 [Erysipelotrichaceae bacterium]|nr:hypothetical protein [Erysipelotrichaceae bacterium]